MPSVVKKCLEPQKQSIWIQISKNRRVNNLRPAFVIGTGRSGTHWLGHTLADHPAVKTTIEVQPNFGLSTRMALRPRSELWLYFRLVRAYRQHMKDRCERLYVDKSHPNIWIAEKLKRSFPNAKFIGIERQPFATVASMLLHPGVRAWHDEWRRYPVPNRFLGISKEISSTYDQLPLESKCALRWVAHSKELRRLRNNLGDDLMFIKYEDFAANPGRTVAELQHFLQMDGKFLVPEVKAESLRKWETQLDRKMCSNIEHIVGISADDFRRD